MSFKLAQTPQEDPMVVGHLRPNVFGASKRPYFAQVSASVPQVQMLRTDPVLSGIATAIDLHGLVGGQLFTIGETGRPVKWVPGPNYDYTNSVPQYLFGTNDFMTGTVADITDSRFPEQPTTFVGFLDAGQTDGDRPYVLRDGGVRTFATAPGHAGPPTQAAYWSFLPPGGTQQTHYLTFVGHGMRGASVPYVWIENPPGSGQGEPIDAKAFLDPVLPGPLTATAIATQQYMGGTSETAPGLADVASTARPENLLLRVEPNTSAGGVTVVLGLVDPGFDDPDRLGMPDGHFFKVAKFLVPNQTVDPIQIEVVGTADSQLDVSRLAGLWFRVTSRMDTSGLFSLNQWMWDWTLNGGQGAYTGPQVSSPVPLYFKTYDMAAPNTPFSRYFNTTNQLKAKFSYKLTGPAANAAWSVEVDQSCWIVKKAGQED